jgi:DNA repair exonuclease SbcCD ATPase subunit
LKEQLQLRERNIEDLKYKLRQCEAQGSASGVDADQQGQVAQLQSKITALQNENDTMRMDLVQLENNLEDLQQFKQMIEQGSDGDIVIPLTKLVSQNKQLADSMQKLNKALDAENKTLYLEVKELVKTMDRNGLEIEQLKKANAQHLSTIDSLQKALQQLKASLPAKTDQSIAPELSEEEKLQQMIEKEREERRKRKEEEDKKKSEGNGQ